MFKKTRAQWINAMAAAAYSQSNFCKAIELWEKAHELYPKLAEIEIYHYIYFGKSYLLTDQPEKALSIFSNAYGIFSKKSNLSKSEFLTLLSSYKDALLQTGNDEKSKQIEIEFQDISQKEKLEEN